MENILYIVRIGFYSAHWGFVLLMRFVWSLQMSPGLGSFNSTLRKLNFHLLIGKRLFLHVSRSANSMADVFAKQGIDRTVPLVASIM